ncbi:MAG: T9SS type A sorting domain-containing protein [Flavobacteriales bacterium]|nr:T9SS type A sorting domain-containing protein [Flavobacteriales bacterium]
MMKKSTLLILGVALGFGAYSQNRAVTPESIKNLRISATAPKTGNEVAQEAPSSNSSTANAGDFAEEIVGETKYDLQTNSSICNRIVNHENGISVTWTMSLAGGNYVDRGTGYNYWDRVPDTWADQPTARIESDRTGWPSIAVLVDGSEHVISHNTNTNNLDVISRSAAGTGTWTESETLLPPVISDGNYWPRMVAGGADGNSLHVISISYPADPVTEDWIFYNGQAGAICYSRSTNSGASFDVVHEVIPGIDSTYYFGFSSDDYAIDADGDNVAILAGGLAAGLTLLKSTDNGDSWTKTVVDTFPIPKYDYKTMISDVDGDQVADTIECNDGSVSVLIDGNGTIHCFWGVTRMLDDVEADPYSYFPGWDGLAYWNDSRAIGDVDTIAFALDLNGDGQLNTPSGGTTNFPFGVYGTGLTSHPSSGIDENGIIYLAYSSVVDGTDDGAGRLLRHTYVMESEDNGSTWSDPVDIYEDDFSECAFASIARKVDDCIHIVYQRDDQAGHSLSQDSNGNPTDPGNTGGEIVYTCVPRDAVSVEEIAAESALSSYAVYPNPFNQETRFFLELKESTKIVATVVDLTGRQVMEIASGELAAGRHNYVVNLESVTSGIYFVNLRLNNELYSQKVMKF